MAKLMEPEKLLSVADFLHMVAGISETDKRAGQKARERWQRLCKPIASLGKIEKFHQQIAAVQASDTPVIKPRAVFVFGADNGIVQEKVTQCGQEVTAEVMQNIAHGIGVVNIFAKAADTVVIPVALGVKDIKDRTGILDLTIMPDGTHDFFVEDAMSEKEMMLAVQFGLELAAKSASQGYKLLIAGEMGIGNTSTATAVIAALNKIDAEKITGRGAGLDDFSYQHKTAVIHDAVKNRFSPEDTPLDILRKFGGLDIAAMVGFYAGAILAKVPVILDGLISLAAADILFRLCEHVRDYMIGGHLPAEKASEVALTDIGVDYVLDLKLAHGEGTGALMALPILDMALDVYDNMVEFGDTNVDAYAVYDHK